MKVLLTRVYMVVLLAVLAATPAWSGDSWASFHNGGNTSVEVERLPLTWSPEQGVAWSAELSGYGQSAPLVWKDRVYVTAVEGEDKERCRITAYDSATGKPLWSRDFEATVRGKNSSTVSRAAPTPLADETGLFVLFESGDLLSLSHDGAKRWSVALFDDGDRAFQNGHGYGASPAQTEEAVIVLVDHAGPSYLMAISKQTGQTLWKTERTSRSSWSSPHVTTVGGARQVIVSSNGTVDGYDAASGKLLWSHAGISGNTVPSPTVVDDRVFVGAGAGRGDARSETASASNCCLRIAPDNPQGYELLWKAENAVCNFSSPLVHRDCVYYVNNVGVLYCLDAGTGREHYARRIDGSCWAQPIGAGDRVYFFGKNGVTTVVRAGPRFEKLASNTLLAPEAKEAASGAGASTPREPAEPRRGNIDDMAPTVYGVAAVDATFFVRLGTRLVCIRAE